MQVGRGLRAAGAVVATLGLLGTATLFTPATASAAVPRKVHKSCDSGSAHARVEVKRTRRNGLAWIDFRNRSGASGTAVVRVWNGRGRGKLGDRIENNRVRLYATGGGARYSWTWTKGTRPHLYPGAKLYFSFDTGSSRCFRLMRIR